MWVGGVATCVSLCVGAVPRAAGSVPVLGEPDQAEPCVERWGRHRHLQPVDVLHPRGHPCILFPGAHPHTRSHAFALALALARTRTRQSTCALCVVFTHDDVHWPWE